jgi:hypothetical protein
MTEPRPEARASRPTALTIVMVIVGILLLLPGLCAIFFAGSMFVSDGAALVRDFGRDPIMNLILILWAVCFGVSLFGIWLLQRAWR